MIANLHDYFGVVTQINYPFKAAIHPDTDWLEQEMIEWCQLHRLFSSEKQIQQLRATKFAEFVGRANYDLERPMLRFVGLWTAWFFMVDDVIAQSKSPEELACTWLKFTQIVIDSYRVTSTDGPILHAMADLTEHLREWFSTISLLRFYRALAETGEAQIWEASGNLVQHTPSRETYHKMRVWAGDFLPMIALVDAVRNFTLPPHLFSDAKVEKYIEHANRAVLWYNDLWSWPREFLNGSARHNIVQIIADAQGVDIQQALLLVVAEHEQELQQMHNIRAQIEQDNTYGQQTLRFLDGVTAWLRSTQDWSGQTSRYYITPEVWASRQNVQNEFLQQFAIS